VKADEKRNIPLAQIIYGDIVYWITVVAAIICMLGPVIGMIWVDDNLLNLHYLFAAVLAGKSTEEVWNESGEGFPGGHFWYQNILSGDGLTQFGLALGCSVAFWALLAAAFVYFRTRAFLYAGLSLWVAFMVLMSAAGIMVAH
jgi:hypothetical protein